MANEDYDKETRKALQRLNREIRKTPKVDPKKAAKAKKQAKKKNGN